MTTLAEQDFTLRTQDLTHHKEWLQFLSKTWSGIQAVETGENPDAIDPETGKRYTRWTPPGIRERKPRDGIVQRRIILELPHEISLDCMERSLKTFCQKHLGEVSWHATIHQPENNNDARNWHAHIVYAQFHAERKTDASGKDMGYFAFEDDLKKLPENATPIKILTGNPPKELNLDRTQARTATKDHIKKLRSDWCSLLNTELSLTGSRDLYNPKSYKDMGIDAGTGADIGATRPLP